MVTAGDAREGSFVISIIGGERYQLLPVPDPLLIDAKKSSTLRTRPLAGISFSFSFFSPIQSLIDSKAKRPSRAP